MHIKTAMTDHPILDLLRNRWSPRSFSNATISSEDINILLEAAIWSFSGGNLQPWFYIYAHRGTEGFENILNNLSGGNQGWAKHAAVLMVSLAKKERDPGKPNLWSKHDLGAANMQMVLQALSMNIYGHFMGGFNSAGMAETLNIDTTVYEPIACIALGYLGDPEQLEETLIIRETEPRKRKKIDEISKLI
jgi:nitroreductase